MLFARCIRRCFGAVGVLGVMALAAGLLLRLGSLVDLVMKAAGIVAPRGRDRGGRLSPRVAALDGHHVPVLSA